MCLALVAAMLTSLPTAASAGPPCPCSIMDPGQVPQEPSESDTMPVEVGVKFRADSDGFVTAVRFYKGAGNTGTHVGRLWTATGANLGTVTFTGESGSGWQTATFPAPIAVSANTTYVASYYAPDGHYSVDSGKLATAGIDNAPLHALRDGQDGANGLYRYGSGGGFPTNTFGSSYYWVDVLYTTNAVDTTPPTVIGTAPMPGTVNIPVTTTVSAQFNEQIQSGTAVLTVPGVTGTTAYDPGAHTVTLTPSSALAASTTYTATVSGAKDVAGNTMAPFTWSFTTAASGGGGSGCPCSIWTSTNVPATPAANDNSAVEVGVRFRSTTAGFVTGIRFYKGPGNTGTHTGSLWSSTGVRLGTVTFSGESAGGWQTATLPGPVAVAAGTTYVASYHTDAGFYSVTANGLASNVTRGPLTALAGGGVYRYGASGFPSSTFQNSNYWVDVVFDTNAADTTAPVLGGRSPGAGAIGVPATGPVTATFTEPVVASSIAMTLTGPSGAVAGTTAYDSASMTATFTPSATLANSTAYTASISGARDTAGNVMTPVTWSFTTAAPPPPPPDQGPGGPVLVIKSSGGSGFTPFLSEVLRTEGLNEFATADLSTVTASTLSQYDVVLLGATSLSAAQVTMFTTWVTGGGNLIAFRPDKQLAGLLGLTSTTGTLAEGYLKIDTASAPGAGITAQTMQYHGTADRYTLAGARAVATLYSNATTATTNPAVSLVNVGAAGGQAAAFSFDLPQSLVYTRQGNPAWEKQERDGSTPIRSDDLYFGAGSTDWVNLSKVAVPQADEQQRLLANLIGTMNLDRKPLPRFWYFPRSLKAVVVATGDDHGTGGTAGRFDQYVANSPAGCVADNWACARFTSYVYPNTPLSNTQAQAYQNQGFEVGLHLNTGCSDFTASSLTDDLSEQLGTWRAKYRNVSGPVTSRTHCIVWSDWSSQASVEAANGIRLDTNYYYWPGSWVGDRPGFMTGSGMPMRFSGKTGGLLDIYQAATQMTDESDQSYPFTVNSLLDGALGPNGFYGAFTANMHTDQDTTFDSDQVLESALSRGVPLVTGRQMLTWLDGRNASSYSGIGWSGNTLSFTVNVGSGANGLTGMVPTAGPGGVTLTTLTRAGAAVPFTRTTIKGVEYASFTAAPGTYAAGYGTAAASVAPQRRASNPAPDSRAPAVSGLSVVARPDGTATVGWTTGESAAATLLIGTEPAGLESRAGDPGGTRHEVVVPRLTPLETYYYRLRSQDAAGNVTLWPALDKPPASFVASAYGVADFTTTQLRTSKRSGTTVTAAGITLASGARSGSQVSRVMDARQMVTWDRLSYQSSVPAGASVQVFVRTGSTSTPNASWSSWKLLRPGDRVSASSRYAQYRVSLTRSASGASPSVRGVGITSSGKPVTDPIETR
ncbi:DUF4082 domain-containing protein [Actinoplanes sp. TBRC 11911]|nr:DUF4082 domain-containing protein [Actinoplanes sp. TBRC 11911]